MIYYYYDILIILFLGYHFIFFQINLGIVSDSVVVEIYPEVKSLVPSILIPTFCYGLLLGLPALFRLDIKSANNLQLYLYLFYFSHYYTISRHISILYGIIYLIPMHYAKLHYINNYTTFYKGLLISTIALTIQKSIVYYIRCESTIQLDTIHNMLLYTMFYATSNILKVFKNI